MLVSKYISRAITLTACLVCLALPLGGASWAQVTAPAAPAAPAASATPQTPGAPTQVVPGAAITESALAPAPGEAGGLRPGFYEMTGGGATCRLERLPDGSWQVELTQSDNPQGFAYLGRLIPDASGRRLAGTWLSLPGSCCPGRGRGEIEVLAGDSFRFTLFAPRLDTPAWPPLAEAEFVRSADAPPPVGPEGLAGSWRLSLWYTGLLPDGAAADLTQGVLELTVADGQVAAAWPAVQGQVEATWSGERLELTHSDPDLGYQLQAHLAPQAGGLALAGPFTSTLGPGRLLLVRAGVPASPPGPETAARAGGLAGLWVDPATGSDFFDIQGSEQGFGFETYGGSKAAPRYLSRGRARPAGPGRYEAQAQDVEGYCCGNQGRLVFRSLDDGSLEVSAYWWPQGRPDPGTPVSNPQRLVRVERPNAPAREQAAAWPLVTPPTPGLPAPEQGSLMARFTWQAAQPPREATIFHQGGYGTGITLAVDPSGHLLARLMTDKGPVTLTAPGVLEPGRETEAWLVYSAGGRAALFLDKAEVATAPLEAPPLLGAAPYLVGASRWPGREFSGRIALVEVFNQAVDPAHPPLANLTLTPGEPTPAGGAAPGQAASGEAVIHRLWNPLRQLHAYAASEPEAARLKVQGYLDRGPAGALSLEPREGTLPLQAFRHGEKGYYVLSLDSNPPPGCQLIASWGQAWPEPRSEAVALIELSAEHPASLAGPASSDRLYTTSPEVLAAARRAGYGSPRTVAYVLPVEEKPWTPPVSHTWQGSWRGEGWGRFFLSRKGDDLYMFWYYANQTSPHYFGHYRLAPDGRSASGIAVGRPGSRATYYRHQLDFDASDPRTPRIRLTAQRLAAPLDDGRLVRFKRPETTTATLLKQSDQIPAEDAARLAEMVGDPQADPARQMQRALEAAAAAGGLLER